MERSEYEKLDEFEDRMWWFAALHRNLLMVSRRLSLEPGSRPILDAGCGTGGFLARLARSYSDTAVVGLDVDLQACTRAAAKSGRPVCAGSVNELPFADGTFAAILSADVLCHRNVDEQHALLQYYRCLTEDGCLILNLPAFRWMLSRHDVAVHNIRRYTADGLRRLLQTVGFRPIYVSYWNAVLFPSMLITRKLFPGGTGTASDVRLYSRPIEVLCRVATGVETALLRAGLRFPFGGSILAIAEKGGVARD
jgi:SAM-dependent methyltransferase